MEEIGHVDHVAIKDKVIACDMKSVSEYVNDSGLDVVVFPLSLMSKNWSDYMMSKTMSMYKRFFINCAYNRLEEHILDDIQKKLVYDILLLYF
jgi:hypothetical protein